MKILVVSTSLRNNSNSEILAYEFIKGATENGHEVEKVSLHRKSINFCIGCDVCQTTQKCFHKDDINEIVQKIHDSDAIVFAGAVYFGGVSGQLQTLLDRTYPLFPWKSNLEQTHKFRNVYLLVTAGGLDSAFTDPVVKKIEDWIKHFNGTWLKCSVSAKLAGIVRGLGVHEAGEIRKFPDTLKEAFEMGKSIDFFPNPL